MTKLKDFSGRFAIQRTDREGRRVLYEINAFNRRLRDSLLKIFRALGRPGVTRGFMNMQQHCEH